MQEEIFFFPREGGRLLLPKTSARGAFLQGREVGRRRGGGPVRAAVSQGGTRSSSGSCPCLGLKSGGKKSQEKTQEAPKETSPEVLKHFHS